MLLIAALLLAQDPTIRVSTRLVQVNVVVRDSHGPVSGLTKKDFKIFDKGKQREIALFNVSSVSAKAAAPKPAPPPGVFTNRLASRDEAGATVMLIDVLNTEVADQQTARQQLLKFLASIDPNRRVAIYVLGRNLRVLQDFTDDPALLKKAASTFKGEPSTKLAGATMTNPGDPVSASEDMGTDADGTTLAMREALAEMRDSMNIDRVMITLTALEQIANHLSHVPGRKTLIWISGGFPLYLINDERHNTMASNRENRTFQTEINHTNRDLGAADVAIYPVDSRGLLGSTDFGVVEHSNGLINPRGRAFGTKDNGQLGAMLVDTPEGLDTMQALADGTGGRAFFNTNDIKAAIGKAVSDADVSYTLGFYVSDTDGAFHDLKVKVDRSGVDVRHRKGYIADAQKAPAESDVATILHDTAASALDSTSVGLIAAIDKDRLAVHVDVNDLSLEKQNGKWTGAIDLAFVSLSADGRTLALNSKKISLDLTDEVYERRKRDGLVLEQIIPASKGLAGVKVVVLDERTGATGSVSVRLPK